MQLLLILYELFDVRPDLAPAKFSCFFHIVIFKGLGHFNVQYIVSEEETPIGAPIPSDSDLVGPHSFSLILSP